MARTTLRTPERILVARNDRLGDLILTFPVFQALRRQWPDAELVAYVSEYTRDAALLCPAIDRVVIDPQLPRFENLRQVAAEWRANQFDVLLALRSGRHVNLPGFFARVPLRIGSLSNVFFLFLTHSLRQARSRPVKPEWDYNLDLLGYLFDIYGLSADVTPARPVIQVGQDRIDIKRVILRDQLGIDPEKGIIFVHPGQSGSSNNLRHDQYVDLIRGLNLSRGQSIVLTAGPGELEMLADLSEKLGATPHAVYESREGMQSFAEVVANAELFIASSTGTLHLAGALDRPTAGFFERRLTKGPLRWQTLNSEDRMLGFAPPEDADERDVSATEIAHAARQINEKFLSS